MLKLSHISCRVDNLYEVAKQVEEMGFTIEWGGLSEKGKYIGKYHKERQ